jgi:hypothetical protein
MTLEEQVAILRKDPLVMHALQDLSPENQQIILERMARENIAINQRIEREDAARWQQIKQDAEEYNGPF